MTDITNKEDIMLLIDTFYDKVKKDLLIGHIFNEVAKVDWDKHLPVMYDFWEMILFGSRSYKGDPMTKHIALSKKTPLNEAHFEQWKKLFFETVDQLYSGSIANEAKSRASNIASLMLHRIQQ